MSDMWIRRSGRDHVDPAATCDLGAGPVTFGLCGDQLRRVGEPALQRKMFKTCARRIAVETSSCCNRSGFLPSTGDSVRRHAT